MGCIGRDGGRGREGRRTSDGALRAVGSNASGCAGRGGREVTAAQFRERERVRGWKGREGGGRGAGRKETNPTGQA